MTAPGATPGARGRSARSAREGPSTAACGCPARGASPTARWCAPPSRRDAAGCAASARATTRPRCARACAPSASPSGSRTATLDRRGLRRATCRPGAQRVDARASGTTARFLTAAATLAAGPTVVDGTARMRERPIEDLAAALRALGARGGGARARRLSAGARRGRRPAGRARRASTRAARASTSRASCSPRPARRATSSSSSWRAPLVSRAFVELTAEVMRAFGAEIVLESGGARVARASLRARATTRSSPTPSPRSTRSPPRRSPGAACSSRAFPPSSRQTDLRVLEVLERMGCRVARTREGIELDGPFDRLRAIDVDMNEIPDAVLALAVVALFADGPSTIRNVAHLRIKETRPPRRARERAAQARRPRAGGARLARASSPAPSAARASPPTTTTAWRCPSPSPACASRASRSRTRTAWRRPGPEYFEALDAL